MIISIHASAKEATVSGGKAPFGIGDFNPRLREGGDVRAIPLLIANLPFQSTPPRRRRPRQSISRIRPIRISIHASAKEATCTFFLFCLLHTRFQSTPPRRRRHHCFLCIAVRKLFQSTPPRRRRRLMQTQLQLAQSISIHASAKEATRQMETLRRRVLFQSTPPRRRRHLTAYTYLSNRQISIHASAKEATI